MPLPYLSARVPAKISPGQFQENHNTLNRDVSYSEGMTSQLVIIRIILGVLAIAFAFNLGRSAVLVSRGAKPSAVITWGFRTFAAIAGVLWLSWRDRISIAVVALSLVTAAAGVYWANRPHYQEEDLSKKMFPDS